LCSLPEWPIPGSRGQLGLLDLHEICTAGHFCGVATFSPSTCPAGTWSDDNGLHNAECSICPVGYYCEEGSRAPTPCPASTKGMHRSDWAPPASARRASRPRARTPAQQGLRVLHGWLPSAVWQLRTTILRRLCSRRRLCGEHGRHDAQPDAPRVAPQEQIEDCLGVQAGGRFYALPRGILCRRGRR
jgi:hypothetical protein